MQNKNLRRLRKLKARKRERMGKKKKMILMK
jgi:hypothetical protein